MDNNNEKKDLLKKLTVISAIIIALIVLINLRTIGATFISVLSMFSPLFAGILVALILYRPMNGINKLFLFIKRKSKLKKHLPDKVLFVTALVLTVILGLLVVFFVANIIIPKIVASFKGIIPAFSSFYPRVLAFLERRGIDTAEIDEFVKKLNFTEVWHAIRDNANKVYSTAIGAVSGIASTLTSIVTALIFSIYILASYKRLKVDADDILNAYFKPERAEKIKKIGMLIINTFMNFFSGQCLEAIILGTIVFVMMTIFRLPYALVTCVVITVTAIVPYVGSFIGCAFGGLLIFIESPMKAVLFIAMFLIVNQIENNLIYPRVVGTSVNLPAFWTFVALVLGGAMYGVTGMIIFIPIVSVIYTMLRDNVASRLEKKRELEQKPEPVGESVPENK